MSARLPGSACRAGHELAGDNLIMAGKSRRCRTCLVAQMVRARAAQAAKRPKVHRPRLVRFTGGLSPDQLAEARAAFALWDTNSRKGEWLASWNREFERRHEELAPALLRRERRTG